MSNKRRFLSLCGALVFMASTALSVTAVEYQHELTDKDMTFAWAVDGDNLAVKISAETEGWVGIGFNPSDKMKDANFILGYVKKGEAKIVDHFGDKKQNHKSDKKLGGTEEATLVGGTEEGGVTTIEFTLPLASADKYDTKIDVNGETMVLLAYGAGRDSFRSKHRYRGSFKVNLATGAFEEAK
jgi:hypothetical protein